MVQKADIASEQDVKTMYESIKAKFGKADALVNNAGIIGDGMIGQAEPLDWWQDLVRLQINIDYGFNG